MPLTYKDIQLDCGYRMDMVIENQVIVELKCAEKITRVHEAQLLTYLKLAKIKVGLILNFHEPVLATGIKRLVI